MLKNRIGSFVAALAFVTTLSGSADAGVAGHSYGVNGSLGRQTFEGCMEFGDNGFVVADIGPLSFATNFTEVDLLFFGFWSAGNNVALGGPQPRGVHLFFGALILAGDGRFSVSGSWLDCEPGPLSPDPKSDAEGDDGDVVRELRARHEARIRARERGLFRAYL